MSKIITVDLRKMNQGTYINTEDLLNSPMQLKIVSIKAEQTKFTDKNGEYKMRNVLTFEHPVTGEKKVIQTGARSPLWQEINKIDPDEGDLLELVTYEEEGNEYLQWKVKKITGESVANEMKGEIKSEEIKADGVPF